MDGKPARVLQLGHPLLRQQARPVENSGSEGFLRDARRLEATLSAFRREHGFGRAIAAPQIGVPKRFLAINLGDPELMINPEITLRSDETFTLWDDCMSFPFLLVKVRRHASINVRFLDRDGKECEWRDLDRATAELLQHEIDHLDGVLAVDRAVDSNSLVTRQAFAQMREHFEGQVDGIGV